MFPWDISTVLSRQKAWLNWTKRRHLYMKIKSQGQVCGSPARWSTAPCITDLAVRLADALPHAPWMWKSGLSRHCPMHRGCGSLACRDTAPCTVDVEVWLVETLPHAPWMWKSGLSRHCPMHRGCGSPARWGTAACTMDVEVRLTEALPHAPWMWKSGLLRHYPMGPSPWVWQSGSLRHCPMWQSGSLRICPMYHECGIPVLWALSDDHLSDPDIVLRGANRPISQIPRCISQISHNAPFGNRNVYTCAHFC